MLLYKYSKEECLREFQNIIINSGRYNSNVAYNKNILTFNEHFYKKENEMWKNEEIRNKIIKNRMYYLNQKHGKVGGVEKPENLTDKELLRGFKISGTHIGYSHFSPFWIKAFIEEFNIISIYDPCGGWGHRLLGAWNIDYYYNDINIETVNGVKNIFNLYLQYNKKEKMFFNEDSANFIPPIKYDCVFTCPPYFNTEIYKEPFKNFELFINWWDNTIKNALNGCKKYFAFVVNNKYKDVMNKICLKNNLVYLKEQLVGSNQKNHFQRNSSRSNKGESIQIFKI